MRKTRRENVSNVPGYKVMRERVDLPLTPFAVKRDMAEAGRLTLTPLDKMLSPAQAHVLERWALNEQILAGKAATMQWSDARARCGTVTEFSPISDNRIDAVMAHSEHKKRLNDFQLEVLAAFTAMQNRHQGALSMAQYAIILGIPGRHKRESFSQELKNIAELLVDREY